MTSINTDSREPSYADPAEFSAPASLACRGHVGFVRAAGCEISAPRSVNQPTLVSVEVATMDEPAPDAPMIEHLELKAVRTGRATQTQYSINLRVHRADSLRLKRLDAELGDVQLVDLSAEQP